MLMTAMIGGGSARHGVADLSRLSYACRYDKASATSRWLTYLPPMVLLESQSVFAGEGQRKQTTNFFFPINPKHKRSTTVVCVSLPRLLWHYQLAVASLFRSIPFTPLSSPILFNYKHSLLLEFSHGSNLSSNEKTGSTGCCSSVRRSLMDFSNHYHHN